MTKTFAIGDLHGCHKALVQCLERSEFNKESDTLITLGDIVDGWSQVYECVDELLTIKNRIDIKGNHCDWFNDFLTKGTHPCHWLQGGIGTLKSYCNNTGAIYHGTDHGGYRTSLNNAIIPSSHIEFFKNQKLYYLDHNNRFYVHGGFDRRQYIDYLTATQAYDFYWDRDLWNQALSCAEGVKLKTNDNFKEIFIGHTQTCHLDKNECKPINSGGVYNLDQGCGWSGKLTIMNVDTKEYFQSDYVKELYPDEKGR